MALLACVLVMVGGFLGGILRFFVSGAVGRRIGETFPWGTLVVNVTGAVAIGAVAGAARVRGGVFVDPLFRDLVVVGVLGGYTTVSSFSLQTLNLALGGQHREASFNVVLSAGLSVIAVGIGFWPVVRLFG